MQQSGGNRCYKVAVGSDFLRVLCNIQSVLKKKISPIEITTSWQIHWHASSLTWIAGIGIVIRYKHNLIHTFIQSLNPISKTLKFKRLQIRHKTRNQLTTKAQSFPRKSSKTASPMTARHARDFKWNWGCSSNFLPLTHGYQIPNPAEDSDNQIPSSLGRQRCQKPEVCRGGHVEALNWPIHNNTILFIGEDSAHLTSWWCWN